jgi:hypothetical protein
MCWTHCASLTARKAHRLQEVAQPRGQRWGWTIITLLSVQLGWGLWLMCAPS